tara:strand:+ start:132 stop:740 length:609 start_codon:yes stop_codon:yes gene_type:complete
MNLTNVEYTTKEANVIVFENFLKMLKRRYLLNDYSDIFESKKGDIIPNKSISINIDNGSKVLLYVVNGDVRSITSNSPIDEFLSSNTNLKKFVIIKGPSKKTFKQVNENYPNSELFFMHEFMEDIPAKDFIPKHSLLNSNDKDELLQYLNIKNLKRIFTTDMMSRYYDAKVGDVFKITRLNVTSGHGVDYRVVVPGKLEQIF